MPRVSKPACRLDRKTPDHDGTVTKLEINRERQWRETARRQVR
jgi:hypothetical protein